MERSLLTVQPIIPWIGGKRRLVDQILPLFPEHGCYVEVFAGAAALYFHKQPAPAEVLNDINGELVNLYRVVKYHLEEFVRQFKWALTARQSFLWEQAKAPPTLTDIQRAARFFYLQRLSFGAKVQGQTFGTSTTSGPRFNILHLEDLLAAAWHRLADTTIENLSWSSCVDRYDRPHTLFYCDPPYWETEGYGVDFPLAEYEALAEAARSIAGIMIISVNDHPEMRRVFSDLPQRQVSITYTVGGGDNQAARQELIVGNWRGGWPEPRPMTLQERLSDW